MDPLTSLDDRVSSLVLLFQGGSSSYLTTAINLATQLAVLEIAFFGIMLMLGRGAVFADSFMKIFKLGLIFWFVTKFPYFQDQIFDGFVLSANIVSGAPVDTSALLVSQYFDNGTLVWASIMECIKPLSFLSNFVIIIFFLLAGLVAYVGLILMGITAVLTILEYYIVTTIGFIILPFAAFSPTNFISNKIFSSFIAIGIKAATIIIISGFVIS
ncbi:type IV secretion system protein, partial [Roseibium sp.]